MALPFFRFKITFKKWNDFDHCVNLIVIVRIIELSNIGLDVVQQSLFQFVLSSKLATIQRFTNVSGNQKKKIEKMSLKDDLNECEKGDEFGKNEVRKYQSKFSSSIF